MTAARRSDGSTLIWWIVAFVTTWLLVSGCVYPNGDDIAHLSGQIRFDQYVPVMGSHWLPNRMMDIYGRSMLAQLVYASYGALHPWMNLDFLQVFQIVSASIKAAFIAILFAYVDRQISHEHGRASTIARICLLTLLLALFPWKNQVHLMAYEVPAALSFVFLWELQSWLRNQAHGQASNGTAVAGLCALAYLVAFTLEAFAMLVLIVMAWLVWRHRRSLTCQRDNPQPSLHWQTRFVLGLAITLQLTAIWLTVFHSARAKVGNAGAEKQRPHLSSILEGHWGWFFHEGRFFTLLLLAALLFWIIRQGQGQDQDQRSTRQGQHPELKADFIFATVAMLATGLMVAFISRFVGHDYFSHTHYPWGGLLLPGKLIALCVAIRAISQLNSAPWISQVFITMALLAGGSHVALKILDDTVAAQHTSAKVARVYKMLPHAQAQSIDTGLPLEAIHESLKPFPTEKSPDWFKQGYQNLFRDYYDATQVIEFR